MPIAGQSSQKSSQENNERKKRDKEERERRVRAAVDAYFDEQAPGGLQRSLKEICRVYDAKYSTAWHRARGRQTRKDAHEGQKKLTAIEEAVLKEHVKQAGREGAPLSTEDIRDKAEVISGASLGINWGRNYAKRNADLKTKSTTSLEAVRASHFTEANATSLYDTYEDICRRFDIPPENRWNMDEKGTVEGDGRRRRVVVDASQGHVPKVAGAGRETVTTLECVNAVGDALPFMAIFKGKRINSAWADGNLDDAQ